MKKTLLTVLFLFACSGVKAQFLKLIVVAKDGSGDFTSIQKAFDSIPINNKIPVTIYVKSGVYKEKIHLDSTKSYVTLKGANRFNTIITYDDHSGKVTSSGTKINTMNSYTFLLDANNFLAKNITIQNNAGFYAGQAVGLDVRGDKDAFVNCRIIGNQDILFTQSPKSREFYKNCYIEGTTDFIFGAATVYFDQCRIHSKKDSHITAASTPKDHPFGYVFYDCELTGNPDVTKADLGRPWRAYADVTYIHCYIGQHIKSAGWSNWHDTDRYKTARYSEYESYGPGANPSKRVPWSHQLTNAEVQKYSIENVLNGWNPVKNIQSAGIGK